MIALMIETSTPVTGVGLTCGDTYEVLADADRRHTEALAPAVARLLEAHDVTVAQLDAIVVDVGPGLFTGLRVGIAFAKGLSVATGLGLFAVSSTDVLAATAADAGINGPVLTVVDARRGEVFAARYELEDGSAVPTGEVTVVDPASLGERLTSSPTPVTAVGDGAVRYRALLEAAGATVVGEVAAPSPASALRLVALRVARGDAPVHHRDVHPTYLREADAVANFAVRAEQ